MAGMVVKNNLSALSTLNVLNANQTRLSKSLKKVSSGMRINSAADDASGYAISERMRAQIRSLDQANRNTQNGSSMLKVAEGAVGSTVELLKTLKEKVINAANDTNTDEDRATIQKELDQSIDQINDNANVTYNGKYLVDGSKNSQGTATFTALTNKSMSTATVAASRLVTLKNRQGENLGIQVGDKVTVSYVQQGKTFTSTFEVTETTSLATIMSKAENSDPTGQAFAPADATNVATLLAAYNAAQATYDASSRAASKAKQAYDAYNSVFSAVTNQLGVLQSQTDATTLDDVSSGFSSGFNTWVGTPAATGSPDPYNPPSSVTTVASMNPAILSEPYKTAVTTFRSAWNNYKSKYDTLKNLYDSNGNKNLATLSSELTAANATAAADKVARDNAYAAYEAVSAPEIKNTSLIGTDRSGNSVMTATRENAITITAASGGVNGQISGFTISVSDSQGNIKKSVNAVLDAWNETIRAQNESKNDNALVLQTGTRANQAIKIALTDMRSEALGLKGSDGSTLNIGNQKNANAAINVLDNAIQKALDEQTKIGSIQSRLEYTAANLTTASENVQASESAIRDADMAKEMTEYARNNVLMQAAQYMLAQANQNSSSVLGLLQ